MPDYESMTIEELDAANVALKREIEALRDERRVIKAIREVLVEREHIAAAIERAGLTGVVAVPGEHSNGNGYTTGGIAVTLTRSGTTTVTVDISTDPVWTASGGSITARFDDVLDEPRHPLRPQALRAERRDP